MIATALFTSVMMLACGVPRPGVISETAQKDFRERDEINQTYQFGPGARVEVSSIRGGVEILNADTSTAEVQIVRTARSLADLEYHKIEVKQTGNTLVVRGIQEPEQRQRQNIQVNHHVVLKLPRGIDLSIKSISGSFKAGDIDGQTHILSISGSVRIGNVGNRLQVNSVSGSVEVGNVGAETYLNSISGNVRLGQVNGTVEVTSVSGGVYATLVSLSPQGIRITSVSGSVELGFKSDVNADFIAQSVSGKVHLDMPNVQRETEENSSNVRARIGAGGTPITISSVSGDIRLTRS